MVGFEVDGDALGGFKVALLPIEAIFRTAAGRNTLEFAMLCVGAALLAEFGDGTFFDPQFWGEPELDRAQEHRGGAAVAAARLRAQCFARGAEEQEKAQVAFPGWASLGVAG